DTEDSDEAKRTLAEGVRLLAEGGELHLASVFSPGGPGFFPHVSDDAPEDREKVVRDKLNLLARKYLPMNQTAHLHVMSGAPSEKLVALAAQAEVDLLLLVSRGPGGLWPLRRATVEYVAVNAPCAVLVMPVAAVAEGAGASAPSGTEETEEKR
ncbi:MAG TPA: universal stress protein, partial [Marinobacter sp.]|nr:universal stress protein [Marinobacter sp.]